LLAGQLTNYGKAQQDRRRMQAANYGGGKDWAINGMLELDESKWCAQANDLEILVNARMPGNAILIASTHE
jgi:hypothetical protein